MITCHSGNQPSLSAGTRKLTAAALCFGLLTTATNALAGDWRWSGTFAKTGANHTLLIERNWSDFQKGWKAYEKNGFRLHDFEVQDNVARYSGVFKKKSGKAASRIRVSLDTIMKDWKDWSDKGYRLEDFETWTENKKRYFGAVYLAGSGKHALWVVPGWKKFHDKWAQFEKQGLRLENFETWKVGKTQWYAGVFRAGTYPTGSSMGRTWTQFKKARDSFTKAGYQIIDFEILSHHGERKYYGVFGKKGNGQRLRVTNAEADFLKYRKDWKAQGYKIDDIEVTWFAGAGKPAKPAKPGSSKPKPLATIFKPNTVLNKRTGLKFPSDMPSIRWPTGYNHCSAHEKLFIDRTWAMGHYMMWRADQVMDWLARNDKNRKAAWSWGYRGRNAANSYINYAPRAWFGPYDSKRFAIADGGIESGWSKHFRGRTFKVKCRVRGGTTGAHPCFQSNPGGSGTPSANHIVKGTINFCDKFFAPRVAGDVDKDILQIYRRARTVVHEMFHHIRLSNGQYVLDTHVHCDNGKCPTEKMYGPEKSTHLSHVRGVNAGHYKRALRNNDNYAYFAYWVGRLAYGKSRPDGFGHLDQFPPKGFKYN